MISQKRCLLRMLLIRRIHSNALLWAICLRKVFLHAIARRLLKQLLITTMTAMMVIRSLLTRESLNTGQRRVVLSASRKLIWSRFFLQSISAPVNRCRVTQPARMKRARFMSLLSRVMLKVILLKRELMLTKILALRRRLIFVRPLKAMLRVQVI